MAMRADVDQIGTGSEMKVVAPSAIRGRMRRAHGDIDGRSAIAKRAAKVMGRFVTALGGHVDPVTLVQVRRAAELVVTAEQLRSKTLRGDPVDLLALVRLENLATRAVAALGLDRRREPAAQTLDEYLAATAEQAAP
jgi:hypothetical protein